MVCPGLALHSSSPIIVFLRFHPKLVDQAFFFSVLGVEGSPLLHICGKRETGKDTSAVQGGMWLGFWRPSDLYGQWFFKTTLDFMLGIEIWQRSFQREKSAVIF